MVNFDRRFSPESLTDFYHISDRNQCFLQTRIFMTSKVCSWTELFGSIGFLNQFLGLLHVILIHRDFKLRNENAPRSGREGSQDINGFLYTIRCGSVKLNRKHDQILDIIQSIYQIEINGLHNMLRVAISIRHRKFIIQIKN